jgi:hypothetical protein
MMPFKNGKKINSYKHSIKLKIIFVFPCYKLQRERNQRSFKSEGGERGTVFPVVFPIASIPWLRHQILPTTFKILLIFKFD